MPQEPRMIVFIPVDAYSKEHKGYRVSIVTENEPGHAPTGDIPEGGMTAPWYWGPEYNDAIRIADMYNEKRGISKEEALEILGSSMRLG